MLNVLSEHSFKLPFFGFITEYVKTKAQKILKT